MMRLDETAADDLRAAVAAAQGHPYLAERLGAMYERLEDAISLQQPRCDASGRCCHFEEYGHRLFVTTIELAVFVAKARETTPDSQPAWDGTGCRYQVGGLCGARAHRPFGCRVYFCDPTSTEWQSRQYEDFQAHIRQLHDELNIPYFYVEWREGLSAVEYAGGEETLR